MENQTITVSDLDALRNIIDLAVRRGAFQANEVKAVGELYEKLTTFLEAVVAQAQAQDAQTTDGAEQSQGETK